MPSALKAIIGADAGPFEKEMKALEAIAARTNRSIEAQLTGSRGAGGISSSPETRRRADVEEAERSNRARSLMRQRAAAQEARDNARNNEITGGSVPESWTLAIKQQKQLREQLNLSRAGFMQLVHSIRASFDSLASGQNPFRVLLQQAPQVGQALLLIGGRLAGLVGIFAGVTLGAIALGLGINKVVDAHFDVDNIAGRSLEKNRQYWHKAREEAEAYREELAKIKEAYRETITAAISAEDELIKTLMENRIKNAKSEDERHKIASEHAKVELVLAQGAVDQVKHLQFNSDRTQSIKYTNAEKKLEDAKQAVIDEENRHKEATAPNQRLVAANLNSLQQIGGAHSSNNGVTLVDVSKKSERHLNRLVTHFIGKGGRGGGRPQGPINKTRY